MDTRLGLSVLLFLAAALMLFVLVLAYRKRQLPVARTMMLIMGTAAFYAGGYALELLSESLQGVKAALQLQYIGIPFVTVFWLILVIQFTGAASRYRKKLTLLLFVIPVVTFILHLTNDWHHLIYRGYLLNTDSLVPLYTTIKGPWYVVHGIYNYFILVCGLFLFIPFYWRSMPIVRNQIIVLTLGAAAPLLFNFAYMFGKTIDFTPFGFAVSGVVYIWGIFRFSLLRLTPLALEKVFNTIREGVLLLDHDNQIVSYNSAAGEVFHELRGISDFPIPFQQALKGYPELQGRILEPGYRDERFPFHKGIGGRHKHYICSLSFIYDTGTVPIGKMLMLSDITELMENEERLRESAEQLSQLNAFKDKLFTVVAHDIRDPIANLVSLTELLDEEPGEPDAFHAEVLREVKGQVRQMFRLVDNLLDWYRSQNGQVVFRPMAWNVQQVVRQALSLSSTKANMKGISLYETIDETLTISADKEMLDLILRNLLSNAIKFTGVGGSIGISATLEGSQVMVTVRDNGEGIDEETAKLLRQEELFVKESAAKSEGGKMRFGLMLAKEFVRIHGGSLRFESVPQEGTAFIFSLPGFKNRGDSLEKGSGVDARESHIG